MMLKLLTQGIETLKEILVLLKQMDQRLSHIEVEIRRHTKR